MRSADRMLLRFPEAVPRSDEVDAWLRERPPELGALAREWFERMRGCGPDIRELMHDGQPTACVGDAPFAYVAVYRAHVNVGFFHGATLPDPDRLLEGTGRFMRHVKLVPAHPSAARALHALVEAAYHDVKIRLKKG
jgi:hypothetical protein